MAVITLKGDSIHTSGELPQIGNTAPDAELVKGDLTRISLHRFFGQKLILNIFPSIDTRVCAMSVRTFNSKAASIPDTKVLCISRDLPYAQNRFCGAEGINNVITLSDAALRDFGAKYNLEILDGPLTGLLARTVIVLDKTGRIIYEELVPEISQEPDYQKALDALANIMPG